MGGVRIGVASPSVTSFFLFGFFFVVVLDSTQKFVFLFSLSLFKRRSLRGRSVILGLDEAEESSWSEFTSAPQW